MTANARLIEWLDALIDKRETNAAAVAEAAGINKSTITKWRGGQRPSPSDLRAVANALNAPVLGAFLAAGFLAAADTKRIVEVDTPLSERTDDELIAEVWRRMKGSQHVMETASAAGTPRETHQDEEDALGARTGEPPADASEARRRDAAKEIDDRLRRSTRARSGQRGENPPSLSK